MKITFPTDTANIIADMIDTIGRTVTFCTVSSYACSGCTLDPITDTSTNSFCALCSGQYWIPVVSGYERKAHVTWKYEDKRDWTTGGWAFLGDGIVKVTLSGGMMDIIDSSEYIVVDGTEVNIEKVTLLGVPALNRAILDFKEREKHNE